MQEFGAVARLQELVRSGDTQLEQYAKGCLANMRQTIRVGGNEEAELRQQTEKSAAVQIQSECAAADYGVSARRRSGRRRCRRPRVRRSVRLGPMLAAQHLDARRARPPQPPPKADAAAERAPWHPSAATVTRRHRSSRGRFHWSG